jgi:phosphate starvation-inducible PhoH-like protein
MSNMRKVYNKPDKLDQMTNDEDIELVSLAHFRGRTFDSSIVIVDEFQNLTRSQFQMALSRLGKDSIMIFCGDRQQIDLKDKNYSAIHEVSKITTSKHVYKVVLEENHRHEALFDVLELLNKH